MLAMTANTFVPNLFQKFLGCISLSALFCLSLVADLGQATLLFSSGYEPDTVPAPQNAIRNLRGTDQSTGFDWVSDLQNTSGFGVFNIEYTGGTDEQRWARIIEEPNNPGNHVLWFNIIEPNASNGNGRVQSSLYGNKELHELMIRNKVFLHPDFIHLVNDPADWTFLTLFEFWNNPNWTGNPWPFRIALNLSKKAGAGNGLYFDIKGETDTTGSSNWRREWRFNDTGFEIPIGEWLSTELYIKEGDAENGRIYFAVTPEGGERRVIFDLTVLTHHPDDPEPSGFTHFNPQKLYTSPARVNAVRNAGGSIQVYWDDFELWRYGSIPGNGPDQIPSLTGLQDFETTLPDPNDLTPLGASYFTEPLVTGLTLVDTSTSLNSGKALDFRSPANHITGIEWNFVSSSSGNMKSGIVSFDFYLPDSSYGTNHQLEFGMREFIPRAEAALVAVEDRLVRLRFDQKSDVSLGGHRLRTGNVAEVAALFNPRVVYHLEMVFNAQVHESVQYEDPGGELKTLGPLKTALYLDGEFKANGDFVGEPTQIALDDPEFGLGRLGFWSHHNDPARSVHFQIDNLTVSSELRSSQGSNPLPTEWVLINFEPPGYHTGPLHGQGTPTAWGGGPSGEDVIRVESGVGAGGSQGLQILGPRWLDYTFRPAAYSLGGSNAAQGIYTFGATLRLLDPPHPDNNFDLMRLYMTNGTSGPAIWLSARGRVRFSGADNHPYWIGQGETIVITAILNFDSETYSAFINGIPLFSNASFTKGDDYGTIHLKVSGGYDEAIHKNYVFDNFFLSHGNHPVPQPGFWGGYPYIGGSLIETGGWLGLLYEASEDWIYAYRLNQWLYLPEGHVQEGGAWMYALSFDTNQ